MKAVFLAIVAVLILSPGLGYAVVPDYLKPVFSEVTPTYTAKIGQLVNARLVLEGTTPVPDEARLNISTSAARPRIEVTINGKLEQYGIPEIEIPLPAEGVKEIEIFLYGVAPEVTKETKVALLDVKTYVKYKGEEGVYQEDGKLMLTVTNVIISGAVEAIDSARRKLDLLERKVSDLKQTGANVAALESKLKNARGILKTAETLYEKGEIELARDSAESALRVLDEVSMEAGKIETTRETQRDIKRYGLLALGILIVGTLVLLLRKRREELG
jgi:hypothetical protein